jgi:hypothetical protein
MKITATNYHSEAAEFGINQTVTHVTDEGAMVKGRVTDIENGLLHVEFEDGESGWEKPETCFAKIRAKEKDEQRSERQAQAQFESIKEMVETLRKADESGTEDERDEARQTIYEDALSVEVRSDWHAPGSDDNTPSEYRILLCIGGPACQVVGNLSEHGEPETARIEHQDWFTPWMEYRMDSEQSAIVVEYARCLVSL